MSISISTSTSIYTIIYIYIYIYVCIYIYIYWFGMWDVYVFFPSTWLSWTDSQYFRRTVLKSQVGTQGVVSATDDGTLRHVYAGTVPIYGCDSFELFTEAKAEGHPRGADHWRNSAFSGALQRLSTWGSVWDLVWMICWDGHGGWFVVFFGHDLEVEGWFCETKMIGFDL